MKRIGLFLALLILSQNAFSWGFWAHKRINRVAVFMLPTDMMGFYKNHIEYLTEHSVDPDKRRYIDSLEGVRHYIDLDHFCAYPCSDFPKTYDKATEKYTADTINKYGIVPWHIQKLYYDLIQAFKDKNSHLILKLSADLGHYIADANVPLHTSINYDGQLTGQKGIHALWESNIPELHGSTFNYFVGSAKLVKKPLDETWKFIIESNACLDSVLSMEKKVSQNYTEDKKYVIKKRGRDNKKTYSDEFVTDYHKILNGQVERRLRNSISKVAGFWYSAWVEAGQPKLNDMILLKETPAALDKKSKEWDMIKAGTWNFDTIGERE